ncbi:MAG: hypothetical protein, partial [Olavius algarvensis Gamma 1 endosymbiont]
SSTAWDSAVCSTRWCATNASPMHATCSAKPFFWCS